MSQPAEQFLKRGKRLIITGFILFVLTVAGCFGTVILFPNGEAPPNVVLGCFGGSALVSMGLALAGMIVLVRGSRRAGRGAL